jgi:hypothetical protein
VESATQASPVSLETSPDQYRHWKLSFDGPVATLAMDVREDAGLRPGDYKLKLNSTTWAWTSSSPTRSSACGSSTPRSTR